MVTMIVLNLMGGVLLGLVIGPQIREVTDVGDISLSTGQMWLALSINVLSFLVGGFIVGIKSAGRTIIEPGMSALTAVILVLIISQQFTVVQSALRLPAKRNVWLRTPTIKTAELPYLANSLSI